MKVNIGPYPEFKPGAKKQPQRKIKVEVHDHDVWSADYTLALIIAPVLRKLQEIKHGSPHVDDEDVPENLRASSAPPPAKEGWSDDNWHLRWNWVLAEMVFAFEETARGSALEELDAAGEFLSYRREDDPHLLRIQNGMRLFAKYYFSLWD